MLFLAHDQAISSTLFQTEPHFGKEKSVTVQLAPQQETLRARIPFNPIRRARGRLVHPLMVEALQGFAPVRLPAGSVP